MTNGIRDNDAGDGATADRIADELCPADRTNPTWRYLVRQAVLKGIQAERTRTWRAERASSTPPADAVARLTKLADDYASRGDFATEDDLRTLLTAYADAARDRDDARAERDALVMQVSNVTPGETRYESAKRIIRQHEDVCSIAGPVCAARTGEAR